MPPKRVLMLAGTCPKCRTRQETPAELDAEHRPRLTQTGPCGTKACPGTVRYRRQARPAAAAAEPEPLAEPAPRRNLRRYTPNDHDQDDEPEPEPGPEPGAEPGDGGPELVADEPAAVTGDTRGRRAGRRRERYTGLAEPGSVIAGIY